MNPLKAIQKAAQAAFNAIGVLGVRTGQMFSLVPTYLANLLWILSQEFFSLAQDGFKKNAAVYAVLRVLSTSVGEPKMIPHTLTVDGDLDKPLPWMHPLRQLIRSPNELMTEYEMFELSTLHLGIVGRTVWFIEMNGMGMPLALWPLRPDRVGPIYSIDDTEGQKVIKGWSYLVPGTVEYVPLAREQTWFVNLPDPVGESGGMVEGVGPLQALATEVGADNEATKFVGAMMANYGQPGVVLQTKTPINDPNLAKIIKQSFVHEFGQNRRGLPALIDADTTITQLGFTLKDLEFPSVRGVAESRIAAAFGVPAILAGLKTGLDAGIRATIAEQREYFAETTLSNYWRRLSESFSRDVAAKFGNNIICEFDLTTVKALQTQGRYEVEKVAAGYTSGAVTVDEYRQKALNLPPLGGAYGNSVMVPSTSTPTPSDASEIINPYETGAETADTAGNEEQAAPTKVPTGKVWQEVAAILAQKADNPTISHTRVVSMAARRITDVAHKYDARLTEYLSRLADHVAARIELPHHVPVKAEDFLPGGDLLPEDDDRDLEAILQDLWADVTKDAYADASATLGIGISYDVTNPAIMGILHQVATRITMIDDTTRKAVRELTGRATQEGWTVKQLAQQIKAAGAFAPSRAMLIARTESGFAYNYGAVSAYDQSGLVRQVHVLDGDYDEDCANANGQTWDLAYAMSHPLEHPNCTRAFAPIVLDQGKTSPRVLRDLAEIKAEISKTQQPFVVHKAIERDTFGQIVAITERHEPINTNGKH